jgi:hypothetical protein
MRQQASTITVAENIEEMDSPEAMEEDPLWEDTAPYGEKDAQYEDDATTHLHEPITQAVYIHLCDEVARLHIEIDDHHHKYREDQLRNEQAHMQLSNCCSLF